MAQIAGLYTFLLLGVDHPSTFAVTGIGVAWIAIAALGLMIAFYYGLTGFACAW